MGLSEDALALVREVNKKLGPDTVVLGSDMAIPGRFTTGSLSLDVALGGGLPANQWTEIVGQESAGKTMTAFKTIAANQRLDPDYTAFWLAAEVYDEQQATALGVDNSRVVVAPLQDMEKGLDLVLKALESQAFSCIVIDSYPALIPEEERDKSTGEATVAVGARVMARWIKKAGLAGKRDVRGTQPAFHGIFINQYRDKIGGFSGFGIPQTTNGGNAKNYFFYARVEVKRLEYITEKRPNAKDPVKVGQSVRFTTIKNKSAAPQQRALVDYYFRGAPYAGFRRGDYDTGKEFVEMGRLFGLLVPTTKGSSYLAYRGETFHGKAAVEARVREDVGFRDQLRDDVLELARNPALVDQISSEQYEEVTDGS